MQKKRKGISLDELTPMTLSILETTTLAHAGETFTLELSEDEKADAIRLQGLILDLLVKEAAETMPGLAALWLAQIVAIETMVTTSGATKEKLDRIGEIMQKEAAKGGSYQDIRTATLKKLVN